VFLEERRRLPGKDVEWSARPKSDPQFDRPRRIVRNGPVATAALFP